MSRILCIDYGERRTGVAVSDPTETIATGLPTIEHANPEQQFTALRRILDEWDVEEVVLGMPLGPDGRPGARATAVQALASRLAKATGLPVTTFDERFSSVRANEVLAETSGREIPVGKRPATGRDKKNKLAADRIAAMIILEDFLASRRPSDH